VKKSSLDLCICKKVVAGSQIKTFSPEILTYAAWWFCSA